ncbi:MAG: glycoside hydrolase family 16 protein [Janthinobacterium lividum]
MTSLDRRMRPTRRRAIAIGAVVLALGLVVAAAVVRHEQNEGGTGLASEAVVTASTTASGFSARAVVTSGSARSPGASWQARGEPVGAWVNMSWSIPRDLHELVIVRNPLTEPGITAGYLSFGDGSHVQVTLSTTSRETHLPFTPRSTDRVRFTVSAASASAAAVISEIVVEGADAPDAVGTDGGPDVAPLASLSSSSPSPSLAALVDSPAPSQPGATWGATTRAGDWIELHWAQPQEISSIVIRGASSGARLGSAKLVFSDGGSVLAGGVLADPALPTTLGFMPRVTSSVRVVLDKVDGAGPLELSEIEVYRVGATPPAPVKVGSFPQARAGACPSSGSSAAELEVVCPLNGSRVGRDTTLDVALGAAYTSASAQVVGQEDSQKAEGSRGPDGVARLSLNLASAPAGPVTVVVSADGRGVTEKTAHLQLLHEGDRAPDVASSSASRGRTLLYAEEFHHPVSTSRSGAGALYASAKSSSTGSDDFGDAIFADPSQGLGNMTTVDDQYLAMNTEERPDSFADPQGYNREHIGAMLASARTGGSGLSAQYGYFEARMYAPAMPGTWPAFWLLPSDNLAEKQSVVAEIDAVELYGHDPQGSCSTTHSYFNGKDTGKTQCGKRFDSEQKALAWHTYGVDVLPDVDVFYIDGKEVARAPQVDGGASPMFFLVNLALGGGWPVRLDPIQNRASLYVDYVRVYT